MFSQRANAADSDEERDIVTPLRIVGDSGGQTRVKRGRCVSIGF